MTEIQKITLTQFDDWHCHLRDDEMLAVTVPHMARCFRRAIVMPNLATPVTDTALAKAYHARILKHIPKGSSFQPLMTLYLTDATDPAEILIAKKSSLIFGAKLYPAHATTNAAAGVSHIEKIFPVLEKMQTHDLPLLIHGEIVDDRIDVFDREKIFIERHLANIRKQFPALRIVLEHISTRYAVEFILAADEKLAATITAHHLLLNRNALFKNGLQPHYYCLPLLKTNDDQQALLAAATSGHPRFFLGTDSAPHARKLKERCCGNAGIYSAYAAPEIYAEIFHRADALDKLLGFASWYGADFYQLPRNTAQYSLIYQPQTIPAAFALQDDSLIPLCAGETIHWTLIS